MPRPRASASAARTRGKRTGQRGKKKARLGSRADKGLEIFSVNEKVCFGKQRSQYSERTTFHYPCSTQTSIADVSIIALSPLLSAADRLSHTRNARYALLIAISPSPHCRKPLPGNGFRVFFNFCGFQNTLFLKVSAAPASHPPYTADGFLISAPPLCRAGYSVKQNTASPPQVRSTSSCLETDP